MPTTFYESAGDDPSCINDYDEDSAWAGISSFYDKKLISQLQLELNQVNNVRVDNTIHNQTGSSVIWNIYGRSIPISCNEKESGCSTSLPQKDS